MYFLVTSDDEVILSDGDGERVYLVPHSDGDHTLGGVRIDAPAARVLSRILAYFAEDGDLSRAREAIDATTPGTGDRVAAQADQLDALEERLSAVERESWDLHKVWSALSRRIDALEEISASPRLAALELAVQKNDDFARDSLSAMGETVGDLRLCCAILRNKLDQLDAATPEPEKTELTAHDLTAEEWSAKYPLGTPVDFWMTDLPSASRLIGYIYGPFAIGDDGKIRVQVVGARTPSLYTAVRVGPQTWIEE